MNKNYLKDLFIDEVKGSLNRGGDDGSSGGIEATFTIQDDSVMRVFCPPVEERTVFIEVEGLMFAKVCDELPSITAITKNANFVSWGGFTLEPILRSFSAEEGTLVSTEGDGFGGLMDGNGPLMFFVTDEFVQSMGQEIGISEPGIYIAAGHQLDAFVLCLLDYS